MTPTIPPDYRLPEDDDSLLGECDVTTFMASGPGGQHRNRNRTAVRLAHRPTGVVVIGRRERSRTQNLRDAVARLRRKLADLAHTPKTRVATGRTRSSRQRRLDTKRRRSEIKRSRGRVDPSD